MIATAAFALSVFVGLWCVLAWCAAAAVPQVERLTRDVVPWQRSWLLLGTAGYAPAAAAVVAAVVFAPPLSDLVIGPHCHGAACGGHVPMLESHTVALALAAGLGAPPLLALALMAFAGTERALRLANLLTALANRDGEAGYSTLNDDRIYALSAGLLRPEVVVSRGLTQRASAEDLRVVVMHEHAHGMRRDNLRHVLAAVATLPMPGARRGRLIKAIQLAAEQACDHSVALSLGSADRVARALTAVRRLDDDASGTQCDASTTPSAREAALERVERWETTRAVKLVPAAVALGALPTLVLAPVVHHVAEAMF